MSLARASEFLSKSFILTLGAVLLPAGVAAGCKGGSQETDSAVSGVDVGPDAGHDAGAPADAGVDEVWVDPATGIMWQVNYDPVEKTWYDANPYCRDLSYAGYSDWGLPWCDDLRSIIRGCSQTEYGGECPIGGGCEDTADGGSMWVVEGDECGCRRISGQCFLEPALKKAATDCGGFWSATVACGHGGVYNAVGVGFENGGVGVEDKGFSNYVRCCRRSSGSTSGWGCGVRVE